MTNEWLAILLLACAVGDTAGMMYILPKMLDKRPDIQDNERKALIKAVNWGSIAFFISGVAVWVLKPL